MTKDDKPSDRPPNSGALMNLGAEIFADARQEFQLERYRAEVTRWLDEHRAHEERTREMYAESFRSTDRAGTAALAAALVINGSAAIAVLGAMADKLESAALTSRLALMFCLVAFSGGVLLAAVAMR